MTALSVNLNKIALLRNSRGHDFPNVLSFAEAFLKLGANGITVHPRPDERHITRQDARDLSRLLKESQHELNIEGYPSTEFLALIRETRPDQCTLVPDDPGQLTSDHGWDCKRDFDFLRDTVAALKEGGVRVSLFLDPDPTQVPFAAGTGADRIELYTEEYARRFPVEGAAAALEPYRSTALSARDAGLGINAGHDLNLLNLADFLAISGILEVSIGHALIVECIERGMGQVTAAYLDICRAV